MDLYFYTFLSPSPLTFPNSHNSLPCHSCPLPFHPFPSPQPTLMTWVCYNNIWVFVDSCIDLYFYTFLSPSPLTFPHSPQLPPFSFLSSCRHPFPSPSTHYPPCLCDRLSALALSKLADFQTQTRAGLEHALNVRKVCKGNRCVVHTHLLHKHA